MTSTGPLALQTASLTGLLELLTSATIKLYSMVHEERSVIGVRGARQEAKRAQIRDAAQRLFLDQGYAATSMDAVTAAAGVSKQTVYVYYPSKRALFADVLEQASVGHPEFQALDYLRTARPASQTELQEVLTQFARRVVQTMLQPEYISLLRVLIPEIRSHPELSELFREVVARRSLQSVEQLLEGAAHRGVIGHVDTDAAARLFIGPLLTYLVVDGLLSAHEPAQQPDAARIESIVALLVAALPPPGSQTGH
jgi:TetR/AcrR family transcriptional regulator, mexJK operon transcriptional repressor